MNNIDEAKQDVIDMFNNLSPIILEIVDKYTEEADRLINKLKKANTFTNSELREAILALSIESYMFGMSKDASLLKQECATTLMKESQARVYNETVGTQNVRQNQAIIDSSDKQVANMLYSAVANMMKTKQDEIHRMINTLNSILISRNAEAKLTAGNMILNDKDLNIEEQNIFNE